MHHDNVAETHTGRICIMTAEAQQMYHNNLAEAHTGRICMMTMGLKSYAVKHSELEIVDYVLKYGVKTLPSRID